MVKAQTGSPESLAEGAVTSRGGGAASGRLAERYRPTRFSEVVGQETAVQLLTGIVREQDRVPGAILLAGPFGTGKTTLASLLAAGLNCENGKEGEPCLVCASCRSSRRGNPFGVLQLNAGTDGGVDVVRRLVENLQVYGWTRWRVVFLDEAHAFSESAHEALLGVLESPPPDTIFVLATTEPDSLPKTVRSRLLLVSLRRVSVSAIRARLKEVVAREAIQVSGDVLGEIARVSSGSLRDALNALEVAAMVEVKDLASFRRVRQEAGGHRLERDAHFDSLTAVTAQEFCSDVEAEKPRALLGPLVLAGDRVVLGADTGQGKSTFALQLVRAIVVGEDCLGWRGIGGSRALFIDAEQGRWVLRRRLEELGLDGREDVDIVHSPGGLTLDKDGTQQGELEELIAEGRYDVVVADPLYNLHRGDSNAERSAVDLMRILDMWRQEHGFSLILPMHTRKGASRKRLTLDELFGSSAYLRGAEVVLGLERRAGGRGRLTFLKDRTGDLPYGESWALEFDRQSGFRRASEVVSREPMAVDLVRDVLTDEPGLTIRELREKTSKSDKTVRQSLKDLGAFWSGPKREMRWFLTKPKS